MSNSMNPSAETSENGGPDPDSRALSGLRQLDAAFSQGPGAFKHQLRLMLAVSQVKGAQVNAASTPRNAYAIREARLSALSQLGPHLQDSQIRMLVEECARISDPGQRLPLLARFALLLPPHHYRSLVRDIWNQAPQIRDAALRAQTLFDIAPLLTLVNDEPATASALLRLLSMAQSIKNTEARIRSLIALAPQLPHEMTQRTFTRVLVELAESNNDTLCAKSLVALAPHIPAGLEERALDIANAIQDPIEQARAFTALARQMPPALQSRLRADALRAIDRIEVEEERAEALIGFTPNLEFADDQSQFPVILERALTMAMMISRRRIRVRVLVALAPHLTTDLQGEALAAVHSLSNERERANLLQQLAPMLDPNMLVASLAVAHSMREQDARADALAVLAHHVPLQARSQTLMDALNAAAQLPHHNERVRALVNLADILTPSLLDEALHIALEAASFIQNESARARAFTLLGPHLPEPLLLQALEIVDELQDPQQRLNALLGLVESLPDKRHQTARTALLDCAKQLPIEYKRARAFVNIAPHLVSDMMPVLAQQVNLLEDPTDRANVYMAIIHHSPPEQRPALISRAWAEIQLIEEGYDQASAITAIAPFLAPEAKRELGQIIMQTISVINDDYDRASAIGLLAPLLADSDNASFARLPDGYSAIEAGLKAALMVTQQARRSELLAQGAGLWRTSEDAPRSFALWVELGRQLAQVPTPDLLLSLGGLLPIIEVFAGSKGLDDVADILGLR